MDVGFELGFDALAHGSELLVTPTTFPAQGLAQDQFKASQPSLSTGDEFVPSLFFPENYDITYSHGFSSLAQARVSIKSPSENYQDLMIDNLGHDAEQSLTLDGAVDLDLQDPKPGPTRRNTDGSLTVAQSRRKAQNRAAQRAFRERKERHVRELEEQLSTLNQKANSLQGDNERLINLLKKAQTENKILKARSARQSRSGSISRPFVSRSSSDESAAPLMFCAKNGPQESESQSPPALSASSSTSSPSYSPWSRCLDPLATWDLLQAHPLFLQGAVDIGQVCEKLKTLARCEDSMGPVFDESDVRRVIEEVAKVSDPDFT